MKEFNLVCTVADTQSGDIYVVTVDDSKSEVQRAATTGSLSPINTVLIERAAVDATIVAYFGDGRLLFIPTRAVACDIPPFLGTWESIRSRHEKIVSWMFERMHPSRYSWYKSQLERGEKLANSPISCQFDPQSPDIGRTRSLELQAWVLNGELYE